MTRADVIDALHEAFHKQLVDMGFLASKGQIVYASIVPAPKQRNSREENEAIEAGTPPSDWSEAKRRQKNVEDRWTKKNEQKHFGYKNHIAVDVKHKFIRRWKVTEANGHDSQVFLEILAADTSRDVYADSAYLSAQGAKESPLVGLGEAGQSSAQSHPRPGRACVWCATSARGQAFGSLHRFVAGELEDRAEEFGLQHGSVGLSGR